MESATLARFILIVLVTQIKADLPCSSNVQCSAGLICQQNVCQCPDGAFNCEIRPLPPPPVLPLPPAPAPVPLPAPSVLYAYPGSNCIGGKVCIGGSICYQGSCNCPTGYGVSGYTCTQTVFVEPAPAPAPPPPPPPPAVFIPAPPPPPPQPAPTFQFLPAPAPAPVPAPAPYPVFALPATAPAPPPVPLHFFAPAPPPPPPAPAPVPFFPAHPPPQQVAGVSYYIGEPAHPAPVFIAPQPRPGPIFAPPPPEPVHFPRRPEPFYNIIGSAFPLPAPGPGPVFAPEPTFAIPFPAPAPAPMPVPGPAYAIAGPVAPSCAPNYVLVGTICQPQALVAAYPRPMPSQPSFISLGASCAFHSQCVAGAFCQTGVCACRPAFVPFGSVCIQRRTKAKTLLDKTEKEKDAKKSA